jgi:hypothetical protein
VTVAGTLPVSVPSPLLLLASGLLVWGLRRATASEGSGSAGRRKSSEAEQADRVVFL